MWEMILKSSPKFSAEYVPDVLRLTAANVVIAFIYTHDLLANEKGVYLHNALLNLKS